MKKNDASGLHFINDARAVAGSRDEGNIQEWLEKGQEILFADQNIAFLLDGVNFEHTVDGLYETLQRHAEYTVIPVRYCCKIWLAIADLTNALASEILSDALDAVKKIGSRTEAL